MGFSVSTTGVSRAQVCQEVALFLIMDFRSSCGFNNFQISQAQTGCDGIKKKSEVY